MLKLQVEEALGRRGRDGSCVGFPRVDERDPGVREVSDVAGGEGEVRGGGGDQGVVIGCFMIGTVERGDFRDLPIHG